MAGMVVGMVGGGQLARMTHQAAISLGIGFRVLAADVADSAALVAPHVDLGVPDDLDALRRFAKNCDVFTFDHEHVPPEHLHALAADGVVIRPSPAALVHAQDKAVMRQRLRAIGLPCPRWRVVDGVADAAAFAAEVGWPIVLKATRGGYDGHGVWRVDSSAEAARVVDAGAPGRLLAEEQVAFSRELAVLVARSPYGQAVAYPVVETVQRHGICVETVAPAPGLTAARATAAQNVALTIARELDVVGVLAVEMFETAAGVLVNELAMRPHNTGHWTIDGARTSQFEQHLRAVLDLPLGDSRATAPQVVTANVFGGAFGGVFGGPVADPRERLAHCMAHDPALRIHLYGKQARPGRKIGHVTALDDDLARARARARDAAAHLRGGGAEQ
jgi:5-(carboxyamino)imidazole ribonucleotide synthase